MHNIDDYAAAAAFIALEIAAGDRFTTPIIIHHEDFTADVDPTDSLRAALDAHDLVRPKGLRHTRVDIDARWDLDGLTFDTESLALPEDSFITVVVSLSSPFHLDIVNNTSVFTDIRHGIDDREEVTGTYVNRIIFFVEQEGR
ncbi:MULTISPECIES: hypothetical protein [unclassified Microbacterium]|uniref:hypothetical protein n=1 Tax=unclassified Microbacterium TaxID=2609290 RepID=UPI0028831EAF|nr:MULTISPECIES: hypothetical protein [unclassified Microbacterium]